MILPFTDPACQDVGVAGGKGASLAAATARGLPVPPGYVVCSSAFEEAVGARADELRELARAHDCDGAMALVAELERPDLGEAFAALAATAVAVRSSAVAEDSDAASFAGQQETYLGVPDAETAAERVVDCWASFFSERALFYRARKGSLDDLRMAVVIQEMVAADVAGILFTIDPVARRRDQMVVEAVFGLGEPAVSGALTPDNYTMARDGRVKKRRIVRSRGRWSAARRCRCRRRTERARRSRTTSSRRWRSSAGRSRSTTALRRTSSGRSPAASCTCCSRAR